MSGQQNEIDDMSGCIDCEAYSGPDRRTQDRRAHDQSDWHQHELVTYGTLATVVGLVFTVIQLWGEVATAANEVENVGLNNQQQVQAMRAELTEFKTEIRTAVREIAANQNETSATVNKLMGKLEIYMQQNGWGD